MDQSSVQGNESAFDSITNDSILASKLRKHSQVFPPKAMPGIMKILSMPPPQSMLLSKGLSIPKIPDFVKAKEAVIEPPSAKVESPSPDFFSDALSGPNVAQDVIERVRRNSGSSVSIKSGNNGKIVFTEKMKRGEVDLVSTLMNRPLRKNIRSTPKFANAHANEFFSMEMIQPVELTSVADKPVEDNEPIVAQKGDLELKYQTQDSWVKVSATIDRYMLMIQIPMELVPPIDIDLRDVRIKRSEGNDDTSFTIFSEEVSYVLRATSLESLQLWMEELLSCQVSRESSPGSKMLVKSSSRVSVLSQSSAVIVPYDGEEDDEEEVSPQEECSGWSEPNKVDVYNEEDEYEEESENDQSLSLKISKQQSPERQYAVNFAIPPPPSSKPIKLVGGHDRALLIQTHIAKPKLSIRKVKQYVMWINSLNIWPTKIELLSLHKHISNGLLLCNIFNHYTFIDLLGLNEKPKTKRAAIENIEMALSLLWKSPGVHNSMIPSAEDIYEGNTSKISITMKVLFDSLVLRDLNSATSNILSWFDAILKQYSRGLSKECLSSPNNHLWDEFRTGTSLFCILFHFNAAGNIKVDPLRVYKNPKNIREYRENISIVFDLIAACGIELVWTIDDWLSSFDIEFLLLQLKNVHTKYCKKQCVLPNAQSSIIGLSCNGSGEQVVCGLLFADDFSSQLPRRVRSVLMANNNPLALSYPPISTDEGLLLPDLPMGLASSSSSCRLALDSHKSASCDSIVSVSDLLQEEESRLISTLKSFQFKSALTTNAKIALVWSTSRIIMAMSDCVYNQMDNVASDRNESETRIQQEEGNLEGKYAELEVLAGEMSNDQYDGRFDELESERQLLENERSSMEEEFQAKETELNDQLNEVQSDDKYNTIYNYFKDKATGGDVKKRKNATASKWTSFVICRRQIVTDARQKPVKSVSFESIQPKAAAVSVDVDSSDSIKKQKDIVIRKPTLFIDIPPNDIKKELKVLDAPETMKPAVVDQAEEVQPEDYDEYATLMASIRQEELKNLQLEDQRSTIVNYAGAASRLTTNKMTSNIQPSNQSKDTKMNDDMLHRLKSVESSSFGFAKVDTAELNQDEIESYFTWLSTPMRAMLKDRNSEKLYDFSVIEGSAVTDDENRKESYAIKWSHPYSDKSMGFICFPDIQSIDLSDVDACVVNIAIMPRVVSALRNTGGRNVVSIKFESPTQAAKYKSVVTIIASL